MQDKDSRGRGCYLFNSLTLAGGLLLRVYLCRYVVAGIEPETLTNKLTKSFILEEVKETKLDFSERTRKVL